MGFQLGDVYLRQLIDKGVLPPDTIAATIYIKVGDVPTMDYEVLLSDDKAVTITALIETVETIE